jgi:hypothetical protein
MWERDEIWKASARVTALNRPRSFHCGKSIATEKARARLF